jgi:hypothetical protein
MLNIIVIFAKDSSVQINGTACHSAQVGERALQFRAGEHRKMGMPLALG